MLLDFSLKCSSRIGFLSPTTQRVHLRREQSLTLTELSFHAGPSIPLLQLTWAFEGCVEVHVGMRRTGYSEPVQRHRQVKEHGKPREAEFHAAEVKQAIGKGLAGELPRVR